jgi:succinate dehydrogenase / fumarate reductase iron-sulfur subunit
LNSRDENSLITIARFDPISMTEPILQEFRVPYNKGHTVIDALTYIYQNIDSSLAFRSSCQAGLCFSCIILIDGKAKCACKAFMKKKMRLEPLIHKKIIRDLVVELDKERSNKVR